MATSNIIAYATATNGSNGYASPDLNSHQIIKYDRDTPVLLYSYKNPSLLQGEGFWLSIYEDGHVWLNELYVKNIIYEEDVVINPSAATMANLNIDPALVDIPDHIIQYIHNKIAESVYKITTAVNSVVVDDSSEINFVKSSNDDVVKHSTTPNTVAKAKATINKAIIAKNAEKSLYNLDDPKQALVGHNLYFRNKDDRYRLFNRFYRIMPETELSSGLTYVFMVRPNLNLFENSSTHLNTGISGDPIFSYMYRYHPELLWSLSYQFENRTGKCDFIPFLMDRTETLGLTDNQLKTDEFSQAFTGYRMVYANNYIDSITAGTFDISYREDSNYSITKMHYAWVHYINGLMRGSWSPNSVYIKSKVIDYMGSAYYIRTDPTGSKITYFCKYIGVFPINVPHSSIGHNLGSAFENRINISYCYCFQEVLNPMSIVEFNQNSLGIGAGPPTDYMLSYNRMTMHTETHVGSPFIVEKDDGFYLRWQERYY